MSCGELERLFLAGASPEDVRRHASGCATCGRLNADLEATEQMSAGLEVVAEGWRTGPSATLSVFLLEYAKLLLPWRAWRAFAHGVLGWLLFPLRYLDLLLFRSPYAGRMGNHCYLWLRKPE